MNKPLTLQGILTDLEAVECWFSEMQYSLVAAQQDYKEVKACLIQLRKGLEKLEKSQKVK